MTTFKNPSNAYGVPPEQLGGQPSSAKAVHGGRRVVFLASDDDSAAAEIDELAKELGFAPIQLGALSEAEES